MLLKKNYTRKRESKMFTHMDCLSCGGRTVPINDILCASCAKQVYDYDPDDEKEKDDEDTD